MHRWIRHIISLVITKGFVKGGINADLELIFADNLPGRRFREILADLVCRADDYHYFVTLIGGPELAKH